MSTAEQPAVYSFAEDTLFIIVVYNCLITRSVAFLSLCQQLSNSSGAIAIFIYDNSLEPQSIPLLERATVYYHHNPTNAGVSAAYNTGFRKAKELNKKWMLLLDQDTCFAAGTFKSYEASISNYGQINVFAPTLMDHNKIVSPFRLIAGRGISIKSIRPGLYSFRQLKIINSGLLLSRALFELAGGYDERFPLDFSDLAFVEKLARIAPEFVLTDVLCRHSLSSQSDSGKATSIVLDRFKKFCLAAVLFKRTSEEKVILSFILLPRAARLSWTKKDLRFLRVALNTLRIF